MSTSTESVSISMPNGADEDFEIVNLSSEWLRLIPSRFPPVNLYERVIANDRLEQVVELENLTNPRLQLAAELTRGGEIVGPTSPKLQNWNLAPFAYPNPEGSTFFRPLHPALELSGDLQTALAVSVRKREAFLGNTAEPAIGLDMRALKTPVAGRFVDLTRLEPNLSRDERWAIGEQIAEQSHDGVLFRTPERLCGTCLGVLNRETLGATQQTKHFRYEWNGQQISTIVALGDVLEISPDELGKAATVVAA